MIRNPLLMAAGGTLLVCSCSPEAEERNSVGSNSPEAVEEKKAEAIAPEPEEEDPLHLGLEELASAFEADASDALAADDEPEQDAIAAAPRTYTPAELAREFTSSIYTVILRDQAGEVAGTGTGFAVDSDGIVVTNFHVVAGAMRIEVRGHDGTTYPVEGVVAHDEDNDLAALKIDSSELQALEFAPLEEVSPGDRVVVIGSPLGLENTVSDGLISAIRAPDEERDFEALQITAAISPGSSGSPVMDERGRVLGVATLILDNGISQNLNFAMPSDRVMEMLEAATGELAALPLEPSRSLFGSQISGGEIVTRQAVLESVQWAEVERAREGSTTAPLLVATSALVEAFPTSPDAWLERGRAFRQANDMNYAIEALILCIGLGHAASEQNGEIWEGLAESYTAFGSCMLGLGDLATALESFEEALSIDPRLVAGWIGKADTLRAADRLAEAELAAREAIALDPNSVEPLIMLGEIQFHLGDIREAGRSMRAATELDRHSLVAWRSLGILYGQVESWQRAEDALRRASQIDPADAPTWFEFGMILVAQEDWARAESAFQEVLSIDRNDAKSHNLLGVAQARQGQVEAALASFERAEQLGNEHARNNRIALLQRLR